MEVMVGYARGRDRYACTGRPSVYASIPLSLSLALIAAAAAATPPMTLIKRQIACIVLVLHNQCNIDPLLSHQPNKA